MTDKKAMPESVATKMGAGLQTIMDGTAQGLAPADILSGIESDVIAGLAWILNIVAPGTGTLLNVITKIGSGLSIQPMTFEQEQAWMNSARTTDDV